MARVGVASRRRAEEMIASGLVTVNGTVVTEAGAKADAECDHIKVAGKLLRGAPRLVYLLLHKPAEVVSTLSDPEGRPSLRDFLHGVSERVFPVGRLEYHASGLVFLTNDGDLANRLVRARIPQTYHLKLKTLLTLDETERVARSTGASLARIRGKEPPWYEATISGASRDALRNALFRKGHPVEKMKRVQIATLDLDSLPPGQWRALSEAEVGAFARAIARGERGAGPGRVRKGRSGRAAFPRADSRPPRTSK